MIAIDRAQRSRGGDHVKSPLLFDHLLDQISTMRCKPIVLATVHLMTRGGGPEERAPQQQRFSRPRR